jgi:nitric oxide reductase large subunit
MSPGFWGALVGAILGFGSYAAIRWAADRIERERPTPGAKWAAGVLRVVAWLDLVAFPVVGYVIAPLVLQ